MAENKFKIESSLTNNQVEEVQDKYNKNNGLSDEMVRTLADKFDCNYSGIILSIPSYYESLVKRVVESNIFIPGPESLMSVSFSKDGKEESNLPNGTKSNLTKEERKSQKDNGELDNKILRYIWDEGRKKKENGELGMALKIFDEAESMAKHKGIKDIYDRKNQISKYLSRTYEELGDFRKSDFYYEKLKRYYGIARHQFLKGNLDESIRYYKKDGEDGEFSIKYKQLSRIYYLKEDYKNMLETYNEMKRQEDEFVTNFAKKDTIIAMKGLMKLYGKKINKKKIHSEYPDLFEVFLSKWNSIDELMDETEKTSEEKLKNFIERSFRLNKNLEELNLSISDKELKDIFEKDIDQILKSFNVENINRY